ncbi:MAG: UDP-N-acetylmuramoyl-tripeptide--D-alanyl-D-alanine ligase [Clostridia bacterium]|nr:UDP-N-acetylmuramoyl-tripeptide--D-alanyl-D-alanine ligase [Clostridia bacterium]
MEVMRLGEIAAACEGRCICPASLLDAPVNDVVIDSRLAGPGSLYVPIRGERFDGHRFIGDARAKGALCVLSERALETEPYILVPDALAALQAIAAHYRSRFSIPIVAITGSVGKTSAKEMLAAVLGTRFRVLKTQGNMNNQTGVPLTLFRLEARHEAAVIEMGTNHFGEIAALAKMASPTIALITNIGVAHIEFFGSREGILRGKTEMLPYLRPGGHVIVNGDDDLLASVPGAMRYGTGAACDLRAADIEDRGLAGMDFTAVYGGRSARVHVPSPGRHAVMNALAAMAVGLRLGLALEALAQGVAAFEPPAGRMCVTRTERFTVLDDSYNANPTSVMAAIDVLEGVKGRRVCILGDMRELGGQSAAFHEEAGRYAALHGADLILCVGPEAESCFRGAKAVAPQRAHYFATQEGLISMLPRLLVKGDTVLVKASRGMHLERTVEALLQA